MFRTVCEGSGERADQGHVKGLLLKENAHNRSILEDDAGRGGKAKPVALEREWRISLR